MSHHHLGEATKHGAQLIHDLPRLPEPKNPAIAFAAGLMFGALGLAIYFRSVKDFFVCIGMFLGASILIPGLGSLLGWSFAACYGAWRAQTSNENLGQ